MSRTPALLLAALLCLPAAHAAAQGTPLAIPAGFPGFRALLLPPTPAPKPPPPARPAGPQGVSPGAICRAAIAAAAAAHGVPVGLMEAIALVESGRPDGQGGRTPWPWTADIEGTGRFFATQAEAVAGVRQAQAGGARSIDAGCMQVNLLHHPDAFASLDQAFDPVANAEYAARFLKQLHDTVAGGDWMRAAGLYHSATPARAAPYRQRVQAALSGLKPAPPTRPDPPMTASAHGGEPFLVHAERAAILRAPPGTVGRSLAQYRAAPILLSAARTPR